MIVVYTESENGIYKKNAFELLSVAYQMAVEQKTEICAISFNSSDVSILQNYGVHKIINIENEQLKMFSAPAYASVIEQVAKKLNASTVLLSTSPNSKYIAPILATKWEATYLSNVSYTDKNLFQKIYFSSKVKANLLCQSNRKVISLSANSFGVKENFKQSQIIDFEPALNDSLFPFKQIKQYKNNDKISLSEASIVVSAGRGLQSAENWHIIENLAQSLGAATACTKPVSDNGWRPHSEHVGQTGKSIACDLYIAVGISGAIQHIAGINNSKIKVVINSDSEAPFFKVADYGIIGDAFEIVPKLTEKIKKLKNNQV